MPVRSTFGNVLSAPVGQDVLAVVDLDGAPVCDGAIGVVIGGGLKEGVGDYTVGTLVFGHAHVGGQVGLGQVVLGRHHQSVVAASICYGHL